MCLTGHAFDANKRGYLNLVDRSRGIAGDTREILEARARFLSHGYYSPVVDLVDAMLGAYGQSAAWNEHTGIDLMDSGCGTGYYAAALLARHEIWRALELDVSVDAVTSAVRATGAPGVVADVWRPLPVRDARADVVLCVFAPRNAGEFARVLRPDGALVVVTPAAAHLAELRDDGLVIGMQPDKLDNLDETMGSEFDLVDRRPLEYTLGLAPDELADLAGMGPSGHHRAHPEPSVGYPYERTSVTVAVDVSVYRARSQSKVRFR